MRLEDIPKLLPKFLKGKKFLRVEVTQRYPKQGFSSTYMAYITPESLDAFPSEITLYNELERDNNSKNPQPVEGPNVIYLHNIEKLALLKTR